MTEALSGKRSSYEHINRYGVGPVAPTRMKFFLTLLLLITFYPNPGSCQPQPRNTQVDEQKYLITASAYCLKGHTSSGPRTYEIPQCIALSRDLVVSLGLLKNHSRKFSMKNCLFGSIVVIDGLGEFIFADIMPPQWKRRVDIWQPTRAHCYVFGIKKGCKIWVKEKKWEEELRLAEN